MSKDIGPLLTVPEFAAELKVKVSTVRRWVYERRINHVKLFKRLVRIPATEVDRLKRESLRESLRPWPN